ncbi:hypothetical protein G9P44_005571 [Scheffersomyces stipitis]|nr:hypothetical protein G9P44_005571 [Scheffersomyces stipitis]
MYSPILRYDSESTLESPFHPPRNQSKRHHYSEESDNDMSPLKRRQILHEPSELANERKFETKYNFNDWITRHPIEASTPMRPTKGKFPTDLYKEESTPFSYREEASTSEKSLGLSLSGKLYRDFKTPPTTAFDIFERTQVTEESIISPELEAVRRSFFADCSLGIENDHITQQSKEEKTGQSNTEGYVMDLIGSSLLPQNLRPYRYYINKDVSPIYKTTRRLEAEDKKNSLIDSEAELVPITTSFFLEKEPGTFPIQPIFPNWLVSKLATTEKSNFKSTIPSTKTEREYFPEGEDNQTVLSCSDIPISSGTKRACKRSTSQRFFDWIEKLKREHEERRLKRKAVGKGVIQLTRQPQYSYKDK